MSRADRELRRARARSLVVAARGRPTELLRTDVELLGRVAEWLRAHAATISDDDARQVAGDLEDVVRRARGISTAVS